jgi:ABC-type branched-subunit amino acid transport system ATPase component/branched-subunit amino acid ABC-type transport system permease component
VIGFLGLVIGGCVAGAIYSLLGIGLVVSYSTARVFNFGHAAVAFATAYVYYQLESGLKWPMVAALIFSVFIFAPLMGIVWDKFVFSNLAGADDTAKMVCGIGVLLVMPALAEWIGDIGRVDFHWSFLNTADAFSVPGVGPNPPKQFHVASGLVISSDSLIALGVGILACIACWCLLRFTRLGLEMRSAVDAPVLAGLRGIRGARVSRLAWILSFTTAGLAGVVAAPLVGQFGLVPDNYTFALFVAITCAVVAKMRSVPVAFAAGLVIGALGNLSIGYLTSQYIGAVGNWIESVSGLSSSLPYLLLLGALIFLGRDNTLTKVAGTSATAAPPPQYLSNISGVRKRAPWLIMGVLLLILAFGPANIVWRELIMSGIATSIIYLSITLLTGLGGLISFAQASIATMAALLVGYFTANGFNFLIATILACLICMIVGAVVALPGLRLGGLAVAFTTLALALILSTIVLQTGTLDNSQQGWTLPRPSIGSLNFANDRLYLIVLILVAAAAFAFVTGFTRSSVGRAIMAVRTAEPAAVSAGVNPVVVRFVIFAASAGLAALGGVLLASIGGTATASTYPPTIGFLWLAAVVIFGINRPGGAVAAAMVGVIFPYLLADGFHFGSFGWSGTGSGGPTSSLLPDILFGLAAVGLSKHPWGALSQMAEQRFQRRQRRAERRRAAATPEIPSAAVPVQVTPRPQDGQVLDGQAAALLDGADGAEGADEVVLRLEGVSAGYGEAEVLHSVSLSILAGSALAVIGANGAGKSTLAGVVGGTVPARGGKIYFGGEDVSQVGVSRRAELGLVLVPESRGIFPGLSVEENLSIWLRDKSKHAEVYERFPNLKRRQRVAAGNLSGGEQQMLSLAPFFVRRPRLLIVDEPTLGLSPTVSTVVLNALLDLRQAGVTLLLIEEKAKGVLTLADYVGAMARGNVMWTRRTADVEEVELQATYLGSAL